MEDRSIRILDLKKTILEDNDADADLLRSELKKDKTFYLNLMSSPGSGKTTTLKATIAGLRDSLRIGVMEADIDSDVDAKAIAALGIKSIQVHTGGMCHLDADMSRQGLRAIGTDDLDLVILENVGNLVCPAEFDTGACKNAVILSIPEGDDKPLKYPLMFEKARYLILISKSSGKMFGCAMPAVRSFRFPPRPAKAWTHGAHGSYRKFGPFLSKN